jgi:prevent-host-death family protein
MEISVKEARSRLSALLDEVEQGNEITIVRRGKKVARLVPAEGSAKTLPRLSDFRSSIRVKDGTLSEAVIRGREADRH